MNFNNIIFDFDHTLVELGPHVNWRRAIQEIERIYLDEGIPPAIVQQSRGRGFWLMRTVYDHMLGTFPWERANRIQERVFSTLEGYEILGVDKATPVEGAEGLLGWLRSNAYECAIVSSNGTGAIELALGHLRLRDFFVGIFGRDPSRRLKPYPDQNGVCLKALGWRVEETLLVGDSPDDILSAQPLSIGTVGLTSGRANRDRLIEAGADRTIASLGELPSVLDAFPLMSGRQAD